MNGTSAFGKFIPSVVFFKTKHVNKESVKPYLHLGSEEMCHNLFIFTHLLMEYRIVFNYSLPCDSVFNTRYIFGEKQTEKWIMILSHTPSMECRKRQVFNIGMMEVR